MTEEQLAIRAGAGDNDAFDELARRMHGLVRSIASKYYAPGLDRDDLRQASLFGLWKGCRTYDPTKIPNGGTFSAFAAICMHRNVLTAVVTANRLKRAAFANALSLDAPIVDDADAISRHETVASWRPSAQEEIEQREELRTILDTIRGLTPLERESLIGVIFNGDSYLDVETRILEFDGDRPGRAAYNSVKVVDNALSRARRKIREALAEDPDRLPLGVAA